MTDVPNLSLTTVKTEQTISDIPPRNRLGYCIRARRNAFKETQKETALAIARAMGTGDFTDLVLDQIEKGVRPATMEELEAMARTLDMSLEDLKQYAIVWHEELWKEEVPRYKLQPGGTKTTTIHTLTHVEAIDELRGAVADMQRAVTDLYRAEDAMRAVRNFDLASDFKHTAKLLGFSVTRITTKMGRRAKVNFAKEEDQ